MRLECSSRAVSLSIKKQPVPPFFAAIFNNFAVPEK